MIRGLRLPRWAMLALLCVALVAAAPAQAATPRELRAALSSWTGSHRETSALVWRLDQAGPVPILAFRADVARAPASTMKLVTAGGAMLALGPDKRFTTRLVAGPTTRVRGGVVTGPVYLVGGGDPMLSTPAYARGYLGGTGTNINGLARQLSRQGVTVVRGPIVADESLFDSRRTGLEWKDSYRFECAPLSALTTNQSFSGDGRGSFVSSPPIAAGQRLRAALRARGITHEGPIEVGRAPRTVRSLAAVESPTLREIIAIMNPASDNHIAETLRKDVGAYAGGAGTTLRGNQRTLEILREHGIAGPTDRLLDGSGLSASNRLSASTLVRLLAAGVSEPEWGDPLIRSMARGGEGTLIRRFLDPSVRNRVRAKTGYIDGVSALAGVVTSRSGVRYAFAFLMNDFDIGGAHTTQDSVVTLLAQGAGDTANPLGGGTN